MEGTFWETPIASITSAKLVDSERDGEGKSKKSMESVHPFTESLKNLWYLGRHIKNNCESAQ